MSDGPRGPLSPSGPPLGGDRDISFRKPRSWWRKNLSGLIAAAVVIVVVAGIVVTVLATRNSDDVPAAADPSGITSSAPVSAPASASASATPSASATAKPSVPAGPPKATVTGSVVAVIASGKWTVAAQKGLQLTVVATPATKYAKGKTADDVKKNSSITVVGTITAGVITATSVTIEKKKTAT